MSHYVHIVPGRMRVKIPLVKRKRESAEHIEQLVRQFRGIKSCSVNVITGSILILYDPETINSDVILDRFENEGFFDRSKMISSDEHIDGALTKVGEFLGKVIFSACVEKAFQGSVFSYITALI